MAWTVLRVKKETLNLLNKVKALFLVNGKKSSNDEVIKESLENLMVKKNGRRNSTKRSYW